MIDYLKIGLEILVTVVAVYFALRERLMKLEMRAANIELKHEEQQSVNVSQEQDINQLKSDMKVTANILDNIHNRLTKGDKTIDMFQKSIQELNVNIKELSVKIDHLSK